LTSDILVEHDVELVVRDGARLYADIYRPAGSDEKIPIIVSWSPYGKVSTSVRRFSYRCPDVRPYRNTTVSRCCPSAPGSAVSYQETSRGWRSLRA
jgi:hypothetical protein